MRKLQANVYVRDPESGDVVLLKEGARPDERFKGALTNPRLFAAGDSDEVEPDAPAPDGGVTGQDAASVDRNGDGEPDGPDGGALIQGTVAQVLAAVGDDQAKAQAALTAEQAKGDKARKGVVDGLQAIVGTS